VMTMITGGVVRPASIRRSLYNMALRWKFARSDFFGLRPSSRASRTFLATLHGLPMKDSTDLLHRGPWNTCLSADSDVQSALKSLQALGLHPHIDRAKNWDAFWAFSFIMLNGGIRASVVDLGTATYSTVLDWLHFYGFRDLHGCDIVFDAPFSRGVIQYERQNIERMTYPNDRFDFATCLSVIEHGVDLDAFLAGVQRVLRPRGYLLLSTDYWCERVVLDEIFDELYGVPVRVLGPTDIDRLVEVAGQHGFVPVEAIDSSCADPVVYWERHNLRFTFMFVAFQLVGQ